MGGGNGIREDLGIRCIIVVGAYLYKREEEAEGGGGGGGGGGGHHCEQQQRDLPTARTKPRRRRTYDVT